MNKNKSKKTIFFLKQQLTKYSKLYIIKRRYRKLYQLPVHTFHTFNLWRGTFSERRIAMSKLRGYRVMLGLTQQAIADKLNISLQSYNNKELGKTPFNDKERLAIKSMVAEIKQDITIDELFYS